MGDQVTTATSLNTAAIEKPLKDLLVLDFSQFLSGSLATLRLADMGARVIKIERPGTGDLGRTLYVSGGDTHGENTLFQAINRNKESYAADLKDPPDLDKLRKLIERADVMVQNFRPGVMERLGLGYERVFDNQSEVGLCHGDRIWKCGCLARPAGPGDVAAAGCTRLTLDTTEPLQRAISFYRRNGFVTSGTVTDFFGMPLYEYVKALSDSSTARGRMV